MTETQLQDVKIVQFCLYAAKNMLHGLVVYKNAYLEPLLRRESQKVFSVATACRVAELNTALMACSRMIEKELSKLAQKRNKQ